MELNENELYVVKEYNKYFHTFKYVCIYDIKLTNITNNESMIMFELNQNLFTSTIYKHKLLSKTSNSNNASAIF